LEDFKQFLPESAAQARAAERARREAEENAVLSNVRGEGGGMYASPVISREAQMGTPNHGRGLPPVGNFAPTPISKDVKRKRQGTAERSEAVAGPSTGKPAVGGPAGKRMKQSHTASKGTNEQVPTSPTLVPQLPAPIPPTTTSAATSEELSFFDRAKKAINNKNATNEFLKLCNLFSQDLIDRSTLVQRAKSFIGSNPELMKWFQDFVGYDERDILIENKPRIPTGRVSLSNCRGLGPSYRLLPKRERQKPCSGRDELCNAVLNDEWASHPTWASEDSGFIAHRKNLHEEGLHRIEEERHDYDYNIEACSRTIQLLEPIAQQLRRLADHEQQGFKLPPGLGGQSETIYKRIIMKVYGREKGHDVIAQLHAHPYQVIPVLLNRLKERLETWKIAQREWEKVWREQTQKMFWKSLDHQAANAGRQDKRQFQAKILQSEIAVKHEEMKRAENAFPGTMKSPQMEFVVEDLDVVVDVAWLLLQHIHASLDTDHPRLAAFVREFVLVFFGLDPEALDAQLKARYGETPPNEPADEPLSGTEDLGTGRGRKPNGKTSNLLRTALDRGRSTKMGRKDREESMSVSRASTPGLASNAGDADEMAVDAQDDAAERKSADQQPVQHWFEHPDIGNDTSAGKNVDPNEPQKKDSYRLWANTPIYCFVRMFIILYERLHRLKLSEAAAAETIRTAMKFKPADELGIMDKKPTDFFANVSPSANYYRQVLGKFEEVLKGELEFSPDVEETLRRYYLQSGYPLYTFEKMIVGTARYAIQVMNSEGKDKSWEIWQLYRKDRMKESTTMAQQTEYRKAVEKMIREGEVYKIDYVSLFCTAGKSSTALTPRQEQSKQKVSLYLAKKDDPSYLDDGSSPMDMENRWRAYIASYQTVDDTDGVSRSQLRLPFLYRSMRAMGADPKSNSYPPSPPPQEGGETGAPSAAVGDRLMHRFYAAKNEENLVIRVTVNGYKAHFQPGTQEGWSEPRTDREGGRELVEEAIEDLLHRDEVMRDNFLMNHAGMRDMPKEVMERKNADFARLCEEGEGTGVHAEGGERMEMDE